MAISDPPVARNRLPLCPQDRTFRGLSWTSVVDPKQKWALPLEVEHWSMTSPRKKLIKIGAKVVRHGHYITFQLAEEQYPVHCSRRFWT